MQKLPDGLGRAHLVLMTLRNSTHTCTDLQMSKGIMFTEKTMQMHADVHILRKKKK